MPLPIFSAAFAARSVSLIRSTVSLYGSQVAAARALGLARSTVGRIFRGETSALSPQNLVKMSSSWRGLAQGTRLLLQAGGDILDPLSDRRALARARRALADPDEWLGDVQDAINAWKKKNDARAEGGLPPIDSHSP